MKADDASLGPAVFINHGGGPMPLLGQQPEVCDTLRNYRNSRYGGGRRLPAAVLVVTAHWEEAVVTVSAGEKHKLYYDYSGFPPETYHYKYPAPGHPSVAHEVVRLLKNAGIESRINLQRGWDHGVFVPMMCMFPEAEVPIVQMSLVKGQDAKKHLEIGKALAPIREWDVLVLGSGASFHNFDYFFAQGKERKVGEQHSVAFAEWLQNVVTSSAIAKQERLDLLSKWTRAPSARECQPRGESEHLMPLFVIAGTAHGLPGTVFGLAQDDKVCAGDSCSAASGTKSAKGKRSNMLFGEADEPLLEVLNFNISQFEFLL
eukprot:CAMPEP_0206423482 /NCGR_PEP_ID=MMETSP0324_2-20121206/2704_1 /ASSEMBLY_ACC=CAM_ASM_000836 /TAXON_ID=2866 /ORGANISM="Crypthecodinium cohnii, Strain Seligo" /LENGTH=316 /DNA_ID=CAMNT_0053888045 /DNA_START=69 /DNA_END=1019 /DNA_ORIENTATION=+